MAKNILEQIDRNEINFFWAANAHVDARSITEEYELKYAPKETHRAGYF